MSSLLLPRLKHARAAQKRLSNLLILMAVDLSTLNKMRYDFFKAYRPEAEYIV